LDKSACYERLCGVFADEFTNDIQLGKARDLFIMHLGRMYVVDQGDRWRVSYFTHDNRFVDEDMDKELLDHGQIKTQRDGKAGLANKGRSMQGSADVSDLIIAIYQYKDHSDPGQRELIRSVRKALEESFIGDNWLMTDSRVHYRSQENDLYIPHWNPDVSADQQRGIEVVLIGDHGYYHVRDGEELDISQAVFRTRNYSLVDEAFTDLGNQSPRVFRTWQKPQQGIYEAEVRLGFGLYDGDFGFDIYLDEYFGDMTYGACARGWLRRTERKIPEVV